MPESAARERTEMTNGGAPLIVYDDDGSHTCEANTTNCLRRSRWYVEACSTVPEPYLPPVRYVCVRHVVAAFNELLEVRVVRRARHAAGT